LTVDEAAQLDDQLPMLIRRIYYAKEPLGTPASTDYQALSSRRAASSSRFMDRASRVLDPVGFEFEFLLCFQLSGFRQLSLTAPVIHQRLTAGSIEAVLG
jgi:hypothetical protein